MLPVAVRILHPGPIRRPGRSRAGSRKRATLADPHQHAFIAAGASDVAIVGGPADARPFGDRLRELVSEVGSGGLIVLGSGSIPLATAGDRRALVAVAAGDARHALANNRYSADVVAISRVETLPDIPDLPGDNALPRWLEEVAGYQSTTSAGAGGSRSTSTARSTSSSSVPRPGRARTRTCPFSSHVSRPFA